MSASPSISTRLLDGQRTALARLISWAENGDARFPSALLEIKQRLGRAARTGITGPPGAGKSTLTNELARHLRTTEKTVGILAVDPSSPITGGALLGDRIRMEDRTTDPGCFIRSMASRGSHGGIARATVDALDVMDAFGFDELIVETVGVGQAEYDVVGAADTVVVVLCPGAGDGVQAMKSGLLEVADVLVVNKSDMPGADRLAKDLAESVHIRTAPAMGKNAVPAWAPPVVSCSAAKDEGIDDVLAAIAQHRAYLIDDLAGHRAIKRANQVRHVVTEHLDEAIWGTAGWTDWVADEVRGGSTAYEAAAAVLAHLVPALPMAGAHGAKEPSV
tara:strand:- start:34884 stop:35882 length:999 start_codon:yes stop_codon:yes gene_type:complete